MSAPDRVVEKAADQLEGLAEKAAAKGGPVEKAAPLLEEDAEFLRKMTPSKVTERVKEGRPPPKKRKKPRPAKRKSPLVPLLAAFGLGVLIAKLVDWRSYAE